MSDSPRPLVLDRLLCERCGEPIELAGWRWRHVLDELVKCPGMGEGTARPQYLEVIWVRYVGAGSESYHVMVDEVEYVLWRHRPSEPGAGPLWSAWRTDLPTPHLTLYYDSPAPGQGRSRVKDPRELTANMPALVAYWLMDKVEPF